LEHETADSSSSSRVAVDLLRHAGVVENDTVQHMTEIAARYVEGPKGGDAKFEVDVFTLGEEAAAVQS
jgi:hypothetical protein